MLAGMSPSLARRERAELCDLALVLGGDAPTLCEGWDATDLVTHLLVREHRPLAAVGIVIPPLSGLADRAMARYRRRDFGVLVEKLRSPGLTPYAVPPLEKAFNSLEYVVHHEDLRRAQSGWEPRDLDPADLDLLWSQVRGGSAWLGRSLPVPVALRRADTGEETTARKGDDPVTVTGPVVELVLFLFGRDQTRGLTFEGPEDGIEAVRTADLGA
jgi:uncharacterized protein (TIGR03085 family)